MPLRDLQLKTEPRHSPLGARSGEVKVRGRKLSNDCLLLSCLYECHRLGSVRFLCGAGVQTAGYWSGCLRSVLLVTRHPRRDERRAAAGEGRRGREEKGRGGQGEGEPIGLVPFSSVANSDNVWPEDA